MEGGRPLSNRLSQQINDGGHMTHTTIGRNRESRIFHSPLRSTRQRTLRFSHSSSSTRLKHRQNGERKGRDCRSVCFPCCGISRVLLSEGGESATEASPAIRNQFDTQKKKITCTLAIGIAGLVLSRWAISLRLTSNTRIQHDIDSNGSQLRPPQVQRHQPHHQGQRPRLRPDLHRQG